jgi:hypothetical protein
MIFFGRVLVADILIRLAVGTFCPNDFYLRPQKWVGAGLL